MNRYKVNLVKVVIWTGIYFAIGSIWQLSELIEYGHPTPNVSDTIIGVAFAMSIYKNLGIRIAEGGGQE